jgi:hypothetical protein
MIKKIVRQRYCVFCKNAKNNSTANLSPLRKVKILYHKVHKVYSQRAQSAIKQTICFVTFVKTLCPLWLKILIGVDSIFLIGNFVKNNEYILKASIFAINSISKFNKHEYDKNF